MATVALTPDEDAVVAEIFIAAPPERVFQALIDPQQVLTWWTSKDCEIESFALEPKRGGHWFYDSKETKLNVNGVSKFHCEGEVLEFDPPRILAYTWVANWHGEKKGRTVVRWELAAKGKGTQVKVIHSGLADNPAALKDYSGGWPGALEQLKNFAEK